MVNFPFFLQFYDQIVQHSLNVVLLVVLQSWVLLEEIAELRFQLAKFFELAGLGLEVQSEKGFDSELLWVKRRGQFFQKKGFYPNFIQTILITETGAFYYRPRLTHSIILIKTLSLNFRSLWYRKRRDCQHLRGENTKDIHQIVFQALQPNYRTSLFLFMGNSNSSDNTPSSTVQSLPSPSPEPLKQPSPTVVQSIEQTIEQNLPQNDEIAPEKIRKIQNKAVDMSSAIHRSKRDLPPLKKVRSSKKMEELLLLQKQNLRSTLNGKEGQLKMKREEVSSRREEFISRREEATSRGDGEEVIFQVDDWRDEEIAKSNKGSFRETRTKKLRLSKKSQNTPGPYF